MNCHTGGGLEDSSIVGGFGLDSAKFWTCPPHHQKSQKYILILLQVKPRSKSGSARGIAGILTNGNYSTPIAAATMDSLHL